MTDLEWPFLPANIPGINYEELKELKTVYSGIEHIVLDVEKYIQEDNIEYIRLIPPYKNNCCFEKNKKNCIKLGSFQKKSDKKYYCWFHVNCSSTNSNDEDI